MLEVPVRQVGHLDLDAAGAQVRGEELRLGRLRAGGETVQIEDAGHFFAGAEGGGGGSGTSVNLISASAPKRRKGA